MPVGEHSTPLIAAKPRIHTLFDEWKTKYTVLQIIGLAFTAIVLLFVLISFGYIVTGQGELKDIIDKTNEIAVEEQKLKQSVNNANSNNVNNNKVITGNTNKIQNIACGGGDGGAIKKILFEDNFFDGFEPGYFIGSKWICVSDDGKVRISESNDPWIPFDSKKKKLIVPDGIPTSAGIYGSSKPFLKPITTSSNNAPSENLNYMYGGDNNKLFYFVNQRFNLVGGTKFVAEVNISGAVYSGDDIPPLLGISKTGQDNDPRVACVVFSTFDDETQLQNDFLLTNTTIYAASWRHPFRREQSPAHRVSSDDGIDYYASYRYLYPLKRRSSPEDVHTLQIVYDKTISSDFLKVNDNNDSIPIVRWFIDGKELLTISNLGAHQSRNYMTMDLGGNTHQQSVNPKRIKVGLGTASYLQMYSTCEQKILTAPQSYECSYKDSFAPIALPLPLRFKYFNPRNTTMKTFTAKVDTLDITQNETTFGQGADFYLLGISVYQLTPILV